MPDTFTFEEASQPDTFSFEEASGASKQSDLRAQMASLRAEPRAGGVAEAVTPFVESVANMPANILNVARYPLSKVGLAPEEPYQAGKPMVPELAKAPRWMFGVPGIVADLAPGTAVGDVGTAISDVARNFASGTTTPENMLALGAGATTSPLAQRAISSTFAGTMGGEVPAQVLETASTLQDPEATRLEKLKSVAGTVGTAAGAVAAGLHAVRGESISEAADKARAAGLARAAEAAEKTAAEPAAQPEVTSASEIRSAEEVPEREVRAPVGEAPPLRQQGEPAPAGEAQAQEAPVAPDLRVGTPSGEPSTAEGFPPSTVEAKAPTAGGEIPGPTKETPPISKGDWETPESFMAKYDATYEPDVAQMGFREGDMNIHEMRAMIAAKDVNGLETYLRELEVLEPDESVEISPQIKDDVGHPIFEFRVVSKRAPLSPEAQKPSAPAASDPEAAAKPEPDAYQRELYRTGDKRTRERLERVYPQLKEASPAGAKTEGKAPSSFMVLKGPIKHGKRTVEAGTTVKVVRAWKEGNLELSEIVVPGAKKSVTITTDQLSEPVAPSPVSPAEKPAEGTFTAWHGTKAKQPFSEFGTDWVFSTSSRENASTYGTPIQVRVTSKTPIVHDAKGGRFEDVPWVELQDRLREKGADSIRIDNVIDTASERKIDQVPTTVWLTRNDKTKPAEAPAEKPAETKAETAKPTTLPAESVASDWTSATAEPTELHAGLPIPKALQFANRKMSQLDEATTLHSGKVQKSFDEAKRAQREINKAVPLERRQNAISVWREAGGDVATLQSWASAAKGKMFKQAAIDAQTLTPEEIAIANKAIAAFQVLEARGNRFDVLNSHRDNYIPHVWDVKPPGHGVGFGSGMLKQRFKFSKARTFNNFFEGDQAGFIPKTLAIGKLLPAYIHEMNRVIADRQLVADIVNRKGSDGRDLAVPTGNVTTVDDSGGKAVLVKPQVSRVPDTTDYRQIPNQPALAKWTWEGKDTEGNPVFVRADLALHPEAYRRINSIIGQSALRSWYHDPAPGLAQVPRAVLRGLDYAQSAMKREMFGLLAPFHQVQEGTHAIGHVVNPFYNIPKIDMRRPDMMDAANHGLMLLPDRTSARVYLEGVGTQSSLTSQAIRKAGPIGRAISDVIDGYQDYLFHQYIPGLKFKTYEALLGRNMKLYADELSAGTMTPADVKITSAEQANAAYGHLNYALLDRNPTIQHLIQLAGLAPDFLEARTRFAGQAVKGLTSKVGHEQFKAIAILAAAQAGAAFVLSNLLGGTYDSKHPFELVYKGRRYSMRSVPEDIYNLLKDTHQFIYSRVNPLTVKGPIQFLTGMNYRGEKVSATDTFEELLAGYIPITARAIPAIRSLTETGRQNPVSPLQQLAGSLGLRISRYSPISETYKRAGDWMDSQKIDRKKGSYPVSKYQQLRYALEDGDMIRAKAEYDALAKTMKPSKIDAGFRQSMRHPFTDSAAHDVQFAASLKGYDRQLYDQALRTRQQILNAFSALPNYR